MAVVVFIPSMLRLHRGLIAHDKHTYLYLGKGWGGTTAKLSTLDSSIQLAVKNLCATYDISLEDPSIMVGSFGDGVITRYLLAGYSVICDVLEENENITYDSDARQD